MKRRNAFFCLPGTNTDGHRFVPMAYDRGTGAIVVDRSRLRSFRNLDCPIIGVDDPLTALGDLAAFYRRQFSTRFVAVTGSVGKTTTKELIAAALTPKYRVYRSPGNYNNTIGIPLALLSRSTRTAASQQIGVLEFGMSTSGEIARLVDIVEPQWGVVTRIGAAHLMQMKSLSAVARAKRELFDHSDPAVTAILNADDLYQRRWMARWNRSTMTYSVDHDADIRADQITLDNRHVRFRVNGRHVFSIGLAGEYNVPNVLAAVAVGRLLRVPFAAMADSIKRVRPVGDRSRIRRVNGITLIADCYNANPTSMQAALESLKKSDTRGRRIAVLGVMRELGKDERRWHARVGQMTKGLDWVVTVGPDARMYDRGIPNSVKHTHCVSNDRAVRVLSRNVQAGDTILIKASNSEKLEEIATRLPQITRSKRR